MSDSNLPKGLNRMQALRKNNQNPEYINRDIYRLMYRPELYVLAYERIKSAPGNMTKGANGETVDGMSKDWITKIILEMKGNCYQFSPSRRVYIPKANGKKRPLGIPSFRDKLVQEVMRLIFESIYDSPYGASFHESSHGFRRGKGCHTALTIIRKKWQGVSWIVEGDIKGCFDNIDHHKLVEIVRERVDDERFIQLVWKALKAGYMEQKTITRITSGSPQGSIVSPILANIYLDKFDLFVDQLKEKYENGCTPKLNKKYKSISSSIDRIGKKVKALPNGSRTRKEAVSQLKAKVRERLDIPSYEEGGGHIIIHYIRYADDCAP